MLNPVEKAKIRFALAERRKRSQKWGCHTADFYERKDISIKRTKMSKDGRIGSIGKKVMVNHK